TPLARVVGLPDQDAFRVELTGDLADRFKPVSAADAATGGRVLRLLLRPAPDADRLRGFEYPAPHSRLLGLIRQDLAGTAGYTRSVVASVPGTSFLDLARVGKITVRGATPTATVALDWDQYYVATYRLVVTGREPADEALRVVLGADGHPLHPAAAVRFTDLEPQLCDLRAATGGLAPAAALPPLDRAVGDAALKAARAVAEGQAQGFVGGRAADEESAREAERARIKAFYEREIRNTPREAEKRAKAQDRDRDLAQLPARFAVSANLELVSFQEIVVPAARYDVSVGGRPTGHRFRHDPVAGTVRADPCRRCGHGADAREWVHCPAGDHLECAACDSVAGCGADGCRARGCRDHLFTCAEPGCGERRCGAHARACAHCPRADRYCAKHIEAGADGAPICAACRGVCDGCGEFFPTVELGACVACGVKACRDHRRVCDGCGGFVCAAHGAAVAGRHGVRCPACRGECARCGPDVAHAADDLAGCTRCTRQLCAHPAHRFRCVASGDVLCPVHKLDTADGPGSPAYFGVCRTCDVAAPTRTPAVRLAGLRPCARCARPDALHCTALGHARTCDQCGDAVCPAHAVALGGGGVACDRPECSAACAACHVVFAAGRLKRCADCGRRHCPEHRAVCDGCGKGFCPDHLHDAGGGRRMCAADAAPCVECAAGQPWYPKAEVGGCAACGKAVCRAHQRRPDFGDGGYCAADAATLAACSGCARKGPVAARVACGCCGTALCPKCYTRPSDPACRFCQRLYGRTPAPAPPPAWAERLAGPPPADFPDVTWRRLTAGGFAFAAYDPGSPARLEYLLVTPGGGFFR
ncbi:MAG TPA: hypothetical protein VD866_32680, partial [Urbifossiella sp.]|nr:hypothetical protein [Urbifossiella sp.]